MVPRWRGMCGGGGVQPMAVEHRSEEKAQAEARDSSSQDGSTATGFERRGRVCALLRLTEEERRLGKGRSYGM